MKSTNEIYTSITTLETEEEINKSKIKANKITQDFYVKEEISRLHKNWLENSFTTELINLLIQEKIRVQMSAVQASNRHDITEEQYNNLVIKPLVRSQQLERIITYVRTNDRTNFGTSQD